MIHARKDYNRIQDPAGKIGEDEPVILFRAQDKHFLDVLFRYREQLLDDGRDQMDPMIIALDDHLRRAAIWRMQHPVKAPDMPEGA